MSNNEGCAILGMIVFLLLAGLVGTGLAELGLMEGFN